MTLCLLAISSSLVQIIAHVVLEAKCFLVRKARLASSNWVLAYAWARFVVAAMPTNAYAGHIPRAHGLMQM